MSNLPIPLKQAISAEIESQASLKRMQTARRQLTDRYRERPLRDKIIGQQRFIQDQEQRLAYITTRMPATYAALAHVFRELKSYNVPLETMLDVGSGPGTAGWAALEQFSLKQLLFVEQDEKMIELGKRLSEVSLDESLKQATWHSKSLLNMEVQKNFDLISASYVLSELPFEEAERIACQLFSKTNQFLVIVEAGSRQGFALILRLREALIKAGGYLLAPCPHHKACPLSEEDWCHFVARVERSKEHRLVKEAQRNFEDEKFCYLIFSKIDRRKEYGRVIKPIKRASGHFYLDLCTEEDVVKTLFSKRQGERYQQAKKLEWGDAHDFNLLSEDELATND